MTQGLYVDDCDGLHPDVISRYYGVYGEPVQRHHGQTGAGHPPDEEESDIDKETDREFESNSDMIDSSDRSTYVDHFAMNCDISRSYNSASDSGSNYVDSDDEATKNLEELVEKIAADFESNFKHDPVDVPKHRPPFGDPSLQGALEHTLSRLQDGDGDLPRGYNIRESEWGTDGYQDFEWIQSGKRGKKQLRVSLPDHIWRNRAELWVKSLYVMEKMLVRYNNSV